MHIKAILVAVNGIDIVRKHALRMRRCSSESVWNGAVPSVSVRPGRCSMARQGDFSESPPREEDHRHQQQVAMGPVQADRHDGGMGTEVKSGDGMCDSAGADVADSKAQEFVQVENAAGVMRLPKQQAVLRGESMPPVLRAVRHRSTAWLSRRRAGWPWRDS